MSQYIHFVGVTQQPAKIMQNSKIFFLGSLYEAYPMSIIESMACGCIVVSTSVDGVIDIISEGENGFLFGSEGDSDKAAAILNRILGNIDQYQSISDHNIECSKKYDIDNITSEYLELFQNH